MYISNKKKTVCILGAGISGLTCAYFLAKNDLFDIHIFEKNDRIGGKIYDYTHNESNISMGGILIMNWYKHTRALLEELNIQLLHDKASTYNRTFISDGKMLKKFVAPKHIPSLIKIILNLLATQHRSNNSIYEPNLDMWHLDTEKYIRNNTSNAEILELINILFCALGYPPTRYIPMELFREVLLNTVKGKRPFIQYVVRGPANMTNALYDRLLQSNVTIHTGTPVQTIDYNTRTVHIPDSSKSFDYIVSTVPAAVLGKLVTNAGGLKLPAVDYTQMYSILVRTTKKLTPISSRNEVNWDRIFFADTGTDFAPKLIVNQKTPEPIYLIYIYNASRRDLATHPDLAKLINSTLSKYFLQSAENSVELLASENWEYMMPTITKINTSILNNINGINDIHFAGDSLTFPCIETSVANGKKVAHKIISANTT